MGDLPSRSDLEQMNICGRAHNLMTNLSREVQMNSFGQWGSRHYQDGLLAAVAEAVRRHTSEHDRIRTISSVVAIPDTERVATRTHYSGQLSNNPRDPELVFLGGSLRIVTERTFDSVAKDIRAHVPSPEAYFADSRAFLDMCETSDNSGLAYEEKLSLLNTAYWQAMVLLLGAISELGGRRPREIHGINIARQIAMGYLYNCALGIASVRDISDRLMAGTDGEIAQLNRAARESLSHTAAIWYYVLKDFFEARGISISTVGSRRETGFRSDITEILKDAFNQDDFNMLRAVGLIG